ncbi:MAG: Bax inhibitor-1/YccA family protein [Alphaproteobacteria bacterium]
MAYERNRVIERAGAGAGVDIDQGLRAYMLKIYNYMGVALALTGAVAMAVSSSPSLMQTIYGSGLQWVVMLAPLAFVLVLSFGINKMSARTAQLVFWAYAGTMGLSLSWIFMIYTGESIARVFFISAGVFGAMSLYGYTTKKDLSGIGSFLIMGVFGLVIAMVVNMFLQSSALQFAVSVIGVLIFVGLTAYDTQKLKLMYQANDGRETAEKKAIFGALTLYLDFINMFMFMLHLFGNRN